MRKYNVIISILIPLGILVGIISFYSMSPSESVASVNRAFSQSVNPEDIFHKSDIYDAEMDQLAAYLPENMDQKQYKCLAQAIYFEARSEPFEGQVAVAYVILNRVKDRRFPGSVCQVVFQNEHRRHSCQFSFACDGLSDNPYEMEAWNTARRVASGVLANHTGDFTNHSTHYHANYVKPFWANHLQPTLQVGQHIFYREDS